MTRAIEDKILDVFLSIYMVIFTLGVTVHIYLILFEAETATIMTIIYLSIAAIIYKIKRLQKEGIKKK